MGGCRESAGARAGRSASSHAHAIRLHHRVRYRVALGEHAADPRSDRVGRASRSEDPFDGGGSARQGLVATSADSESIIAVEVVGAYLERLRAGTEL